MLYTAHPQSEVTPAATSSSSSSSRRSSPRMEGPNRIEAGSSSSRKSSPGRTPPADLPSRGRYTTLEKLLMATCVATLFSNVVLWIVGLVVAGFWLTRML